MYYIRQHFRDNNSLKLQKYRQLTKLYGGILLLFSFWFGWLVYFILFYHWPLLIQWFVDSVCVCVNMIQASYLGDIMGLVLDHCNKASIAMKWLIIYLLVETLAFICKKKKMQHLWSIIKQNAIKWGLSLYKKDYAPWPSEIYPRNVRAIQHTKKKNQSMLYAISIE